MAKAKTAKSLPIVLSLFFVAACGAGEPDYPPIVQPSGSPQFRQPEGSIFGDQGLSLSFLNGEEQGEGPGAPGIGVNSFLWRASLDTVSFMPITSADPFGGVILTDWFSPAETPDERFKLNVYILDRQLRADGIRVSVFRQIRSGNGGWADAQVAGTTGRDLEDTILTRARQLRIASTPTG